MIVYDDQLSVEISLDRVENCEARLVPSLPLGQLPPSPLQLPLRPPFCEGMHPARSLPLAFGALGKSLFYGSEFDSGSHNRLFRFWCRFWAGFTARVSGFFGSLSVFGDPPRFAEGSEGPLVENAGSFLGGPFGSPQFRPVLGPIVRFRTFPPSVHLLALSL